MSWQYWLNDIDDPALIAEKNELELDEMKLRQRWAEFTARVNRRYTEHWEARRTHLCRYCKSQTPGQNNCQNCGAPRI